MIDNPTAYADCAQHEALRVLHAWGAAGYPQDTKAFGQTESPCGSGTFYAIAENAQTMADELVRDCPDWVAENSEPFDVLLDYIFSALDCTL